MKLFIYDGSFAGLLTAVFEVYEYKAGEALISKQQETNFVTSENQNVFTDLNKSDRVWKGLKQKASAELCREIYFAYLSEIKGIENSILRLARYVFSSPVNVENDYGHTDVLKVKQTAKKVGREKHRFEAFVRFNELPENLFYASIDPDYNVLPVILPHFKRRYADQDWIIYDTKRKYGIAFNKLTQEVSETVINFTPEAKYGISKSLMINTTEKLYQDLWKNYFNSTTIYARKNIKLHLQHVPRRYWKYLTEKQ